MESWIPTALGMVAGTLSTASFVPQVYKAWKDGDTKALSKRTYMVNVTSFVLWSIYGVMIDSLPVIVFNILSLGLSGTILFLKIRQQGAEPSRETLPLREPAPARPR